MRCALQQHKSAAIYVALTRWGKGSLCVQGLQVIAATTFITPTICDQCTQASKVAFVKEGLVRAVCATVADEAVGTGAASVAAAAAAAAAGGTRVSLSGLVASPGSKDGSTAQDGAPTITEAQLLHLEVVQSCLHALLVSSLPGVPWAGLHAQGLVGTEVWEAHA